MGFLNRFFTLIGTILLVLAMTVLLAAPQALADLVTRVNAIQPVVRILLAVLIDALLLLWLYRRLRAQPKEGLVVRARGVKAEVNIDSVQRQINARVDEITDVLAVQTEVLADKGGAQITLHVRTQPDIVVPEKQKEITRVLKQVVEKQMGLRLAGPPAIHISLDTVPLTDSARAAMTGAVEPETPEPAPAPALADVSSVDVSTVNSTSRATPEKSARGSSDVIEAEFVSADEAPAATRTPAPPPASAPASTSAPDSAGDPDYASPDEPTTSGRDDEETTVPLKNNSAPAAEAPDPADSEEEPWQSFLLDEEEPN